MHDYILESIFLDTSLWREVIEHGIDKNIEYGWLEKLADPHCRADLAVQIAKGEYQIQPPHTGYRKKDDGSERMFLANDPQDRLLLNVIYRWLSINDADMIHPSCKSYQTGIGIGKIVKDISRRITYHSKIAHGKVVGRKFDIHKYFESIGRDYIHQAFDSVEMRHGSSSVIDLLREYYETDVYYDIRQHTLVEAYQGIKQGCAVSAWLANVLLSSLDEELSRRNGLYVRYSDDIIYIGDDYEVVTLIIQNHLSKMGLQLNERKITNIVAGDYFCFLGFQINGPDITLSRKWVKHFQKQIDKCTIHNTELIKKVRKIRQEGGDKQELKLKRVLEKIKRDLARYLLYGNGRYSWATEVLPTVNNTSDIQQLTIYCLDAIRAVYTGHTNIGGLGKSLKSGIQRGKGKHVKSNRMATRHLEDNDSEHIRGFISLHAVQKAITNKWLFRCLAVNMVDTKSHPLYGQVDTSANGQQSVDQIIEMLESLYENYLNSQPNGRAIERFYGYSLSEMTTESLIKGGNREEALTAFENLLVEKVMFSTLQESAESWYWQSKMYPQLVLLKEWFKN